jgi:hypothetical protein
VARQRTKEYIASLNYKIEELLERPTADDQRRLAELKQQNEVLREELKQLKATMGANASFHASKTNPIGIASPPWQDQNTPDDISTINSASTYVHSPSSGFDTLHNATDTTPNALCRQTYISLETPNHDTTVAVSNTAPIWSFPTHNSSSIPTSFVNQPSTKFWEFPVLLSPPENIIDRYLVSILHGQRNENIQSLPIRIFKHRPSICSIVSPDAARPDDMVSSTIAKLIQSAGVSRLAETIGSLYTVYKIMQWQIFPCLKTYNNLPAWLTPRPSQLTVVHPSWVSQVKFPKLRDVVIEQQDMYANNQFLFLYTTSLCVNWPFEEAGILTLENGIITVSEAFEKYILDLGNWSLSEPFSLAYPELQWACTFTSLAQK